LVGEGEDRYAARKEMTERPDWRGPGYQTCMNAAVVARRFPKTSRYREGGTSAGLTYSHLASVTAMSDVDADALLDWALQPVADGKRPRTVLALRQERERRAELGRQAELRRVIGEIQGLSQLQPTQPLVMSRAFEPSNGPHASAMTTDAAETAPLGVLGTRYVPRDLTDTEMLAVFSQKLRFLVRHYAAELPPANLADLLTEEAEALRRNRGEPE
jgi:hypothetical protein